MENNVQQRETTSIFEDGGRKFEITSFDPIEGNYILLQVINFILPFGLGDILSKEVGSEISSLQPEAPTMMSKEDFISLQRDILKTINEVYESGAKSPVVRSNGTYGIPNVSMALFLKLIIASLTFNFKSFFADVPSLEAIIEDQVSPFANTQI